MLRKFSFCYLVQDPHDFLYACYILISKYVNVPRYIIKENIYIANEVRKRCF